MIIREGPFIAKFVANEFFVAVNINSSTSYLYKIRNVGDFGQNMFLAPGFVLGYQRFYSKITAIEYAESMTMIGFKDGRLAKIYGTGGTGANMFNISESAGGFQQTSTSYTNYLAGSHRFRNGVIDIFYISGKTLVCFEKELLGLQKAKILKINGTGGTGYNVFAISETNISFSSISGYSYYSGYQTGNSNVTDITIVGNCTFICFRDGRHIKLNGTGGSGANMFAMTETSYGYGSLAGYNYLVGSFRYSDYIVKGFVRGNVTFFSLTDGRIMKIKGAGGTGQNMFNIEETPSGFQTYNTSYSVYLLGDYRFTTAGKNVVYVIDMDYIDGNLILAIYGGYVLKILNVGGTGHNMFNIALVAGAFEIFSTSYASYLLGGQSMSANSRRLSQIINFETFTFVLSSRIGSGNLNYALKLKNTGINNFSNMFGISENLDYSYSETTSYSIISAFTGWQTFPNSYP